MSLASEADRALANIVSQRHGAFTRSEARAYGFTDRMIHTRVQHGLWHRVHPHVFVLASTRGTPLLRYEAATIATPNAALSGRAAAHLHEFVGCRAAVPEITVRNSGNPRLSGVRVRRRYRIETTRVAGINVTTPAQTLLDITPVLPVRILEPVFDDALLRSRAEPAALRRMQRTAGLRRAPGRRLFDALVEERLDDVAVAESVLEMALARIVRSAGVCDAVAQARFSWWLGGAGRWDCALLPWRILLEADGRAWHARVAAFDDDRWRDATAAANGFVVLRFTATHLRHRADDCVELVRQVITTRQSIAA